LQLAFLINQLTWRMIMSIQSINKITLLGHAGSDPDVSAEGKQPYASLSLATNKSWKDKEGVTQEKVAWHKVIFFGKSAEFIKEYVRSGMRLYIEGELEYNQWEDHEGNMNHEVRIIAKEWPILLDKVTASESDSSTLS
jgi:single-strand DNA-binding protein